jgi:hypothetical protein
MPTFKRLDPYLSQTANELLVYNLLFKEDGETEPKLREAEASKHLAVDLALASNILRGQPFARSLPDPDTDAFDTMSRAAEALSIADEPRSVNFGFLQPAKTTPPAVVPLGVRLLLQDWEVGADSHSYKYEDPYEADNAVSSQRFKAYQELRGSGETLASQSRLPPTIASTKPVARPITSTQPVRGVFSQVERPFRATQVDTTAHSQGDSRDLEEYSQKPMASTQVMPGPFGGRRTIVKKKVGKKRIGGF